MPDKTITVDVELLRNCAAALCIGQEFGDVSKAIHGQAKRKYDFLKETLETLQETLRKNLDDDH